MHDQLLQPKDGIAAIAQVESQLMRPGKLAAEPVVSIAIPQYRRPAMLREALRSALTQDTPELFEVLVVDDDPDPTRAGEIDRIIDDFADQRLRLFRNTRNLGVYGNWSKCLQLARGRWVTLMDNDDLMSPDFLQRCLDVVGSRPDAKLVGCRYAIQDERVAHDDKQHAKLGHQWKNMLLYRRHSARCRRLRIADVFVDYPFAGVTGVMMERHAALSLGGFYPGYWPSSDAIFVVRFVKQHPSYLIRRPLVTSRIFDNDASRESAIAGFIRYGLRLRAELIPLIGCCPNLLRWYAEVKALSLLRALYVTFHGRLPSPELIAELGLPMLPMSTVYWVANAATMLLPVVFWGQRDRT